jgi:hypothetical protein
VTARAGVTPVPPMGPARHPRRDLTTAVGHVLTSWTAGCAAGTAGPDLGPAVLVALLDDPDTTRATVPAWLRLGARSGLVGLHGGMSGVLAGLRVLADVHPGAGPAAHRTAAALAALAGRHEWRRAEVGFDDYDLVSGPAGMLLAHTAGSLPTGTEHLATLTEHLAGLASDAELTGLRIGAHRNHPLVGWTQGGIVSGLAHGVAGPLVALSTGPVAGEDVLASVLYLSSWLVAEQTVDALGVASWPRLGPTERDGLAGVIRRQAWCYGNPGVSWALWTAGAALTKAGRIEGPALCATAAEAMGTLCERFDPEVHLDTEELSVCHGAAGIMLVADAFARHAELAVAAALRDRLADVLRGRLADVVRLAGSDTSLLMGASGVLAALLTVDGADRTWLRCLGLS